MTKSHFKLPEYISLTFKVKIKGTFLKPNVPTASNTVRSRPGVLLMSLYSKGEKHKRTIRKWS